MPNACGATTEGRCAFGSAAIARSSSSAQGPGEPARATTWIRPASSSSMSTGIGVAEASRSTTGSMPAPGAAEARAVANAVAAPGLWLTIATRVAPSASASCAAAVPWSAVVGARRSAPGRLPAAFSGETSSSPAGRSTCSARLLQASS